MRRVKRSRQKADEMPLGRLTDRYIVMVLVGQNDLHVSRVVGNGVVAEVQQTRAAQTQPDLHVYMIMKKFNRPWLKMICADAAHRPTHIGGRGLKQTGKRLIENSARQSGRCGCFFHGGTPFRLQKPAK